MEKLTLEFNSFEKCCAILADHCLPDELPRHCHLSPEDRRLFFYIWVAWSRRNNTKIDKNERLSCPMRGCRKRFAKWRQLLDHVYSCPLLAEGSYWCPNCQCYENFLSGTPTGFPTKTISSAFRVLSKPLRLAPIKEAQKDLLKCATRFFVGLGSQGLSLIIEYIFRRRARPGYLSRTELDRGDIDYLLGSKPTYLENGVTKPLSERSQLETALTRPEQELIQRPSQSIPNFQSLPSPTTSFDFAHSVEKSLHSILPQSESINLIDPSSKRSLSPSDESDLGLAPSAYTAATSSTSLTLIGSSSSVGDRFENDNQRSRLSPSGYSAIPTTRYGIVAATNESSLGADVSTNNALPTSFGARNSLALATVAAATALPELLELRKSCLVTPLGPEMLHCLLPSCSFLCFDVATLDHHYKLQHFSDVAITTSSTTASHSTTKPTLQTGSILEYMTDQNLIEDVCKLLSIQYDLTVQKTRKSSLPSARSFEDDCPSPRDLLAQGLAALNRMVDHILPTTFSEVFALVHLGYAAAMVYYRQEFMEHSLKMFTSVLDWGQAISSPRDRSEFDTISRQIWSPWNLGIFQSPKPQSASGISTLSEEQPGQANAVLKPTCNFSLRDPTSTKQPPIAAQDQLSPPGGSSLLDTLRQGMVAEMCMHCLSIFEYSEFSKEQTRRQLKQRDPSSRILASRPDFFSMVRERITRPLIKYHGLQCFTQCVAIVEMCVDRGALLCVREVEIKLIHDGRLLCESQPLYRRFLQTVHELCNHAANSIGLDSNFRDEYLRGDINKIQGTLREMDYVELFTVSPSGSRSSSLGTTESTQSGKLETIVECPVIDNSMSSVEPQIHTTEPSLEWAHVPLEESISYDFDQQSVEEISRPDLLPELSSLYSEYQESAFVEFARFSTIGLDRSSLTKAAENRCSSPTLGAWDSALSLPDFNDQELATKPSLVRPSRPSFLLLDSSQALTEPSTISPTETSSTTISPTDSNFTSTSTSTSASTLSSLPSPTFPDDNVYPLFYSSSVEEKPPSPHAPTQLNSGYFFATCNRCGTRFHGRHRLTNLRRHIRTIHTKQWVPCPDKDCDRVFTRAEYLRNHQRRSHPGIAF